MAEVTVVIPSYNQGRFLHQALESVFAQNVDMEVYVIDGGSTDNSVDVIKRWQHKLAGWQSRPDKGQADAINQGVAKGAAPFVCWLNSDDLFMPEGLTTLLGKLKHSPSAPAVYGDCWHITEAGQRHSRYLTLPFSPHLLANYCFIGQPATLIRRDAWQAVGGLDESLQMAMDFDLWWKLYRHGGCFVRTRETCAANRMHADTKTHNRLDEHYQESMQVVKNHYGRVPLKWYVLKPVMKLVRAIARYQYRRKK
ncbi:glycosyltransferase family 2 protein [Alteromonas halophila]|uniref:Glycosyltransferase 2-like domain-containing protein n=1 Tax=Alteromonas halophila TaxID=516698 RepID=A0A918MY46_9ALTE|nr:glycosyltransferase family 2 protein [Alteromonas halophila]GGW82277.1 hypothetical protein GCM10007391_14130 [Alteromonas halophila]